MDDEKALALARRLDDENPQVRMEALEEVRDDEEVLRMIAQSSRHKDLRMEAIRQIKARGVSFYLDGSSFQVAWVRKVCGTRSRMRSIEEQLLIVDVLEDEEAAARIACNAHLGVELEVRKRVLERFREDEGMLRAIGQAVQGRDPEIACMAARLLLPLCDDKEDAYLTLATYSPDEEERTDAFGRISHDEGNLSHIARLCPFPDMQGKAIGGMEEKLGDIVCTYLGPSAGGLLTGGRDIYDRGQAWQLATRKLISLGKLDILKGKVSRLLNNNWKHEVYHGWAHDIIDEVAGTPGLDGGAWWDERIARWTREKEVRVRIVDKTSDDKVLREAALGAGPDERGLMEKAIGKISSGSMLKDLAWDTSTKARYISGGYRRGREYEFAPITDAAIAALRKHPSHYLQAYLGFCRRANQVFSRGLNKEAAIVMAKDIGSIILRMDPNIKEHLSLLKEAVSCGGAECRGWAFKRLKGLHDEIAAVCPRCEDAGVVEAALDILIREAPSRFVALVSEWQHKEYRTSRAYREGLLHALGNMKDERLLMEVWEGMKARDLREACRKRMKELGADAEVLAALRKANPLQGEGEAVDSRRLTNRPVGEKGEDKLKLKR